MVQVTGLEDERVLSSFFGTHEIPHRNAVERY